MATVLSVSGFCLNGNVSACKDGYLCESTINSLKTKVENYIDGFFDSGLGYGHSVERFFNVDNFKKDFTSEKVDSLVEEIFGKDHAKFLRNEIKAWLVYACVYNRLLYCQSNIRSGQGNSIASVSAMSLIRKLIANIPEEEFEFSEQKIKFSDEDLDELLKKNLKETNLWDLIYTPLTQFTDIQKTPYNITNILYHSTFSQGVFAVKGENEVYHLPIEEERPDNQWDNNERYVYSIMRKARYHICQTLNINSRIINWDINGLKFQEEPSDLFPKAKGVQSTRRLSSPTKLN